MLQTGCMMLMNNYCTVYAGPDRSTSRKRLSSSASTHESQSAEGSLSESTKRLKIGPGNNELDMDKIIKDHFLGMILATCYIFLMLQHTKAKTC